MQTETKKTEQQVTEVKNVQSPVTGATAPAGSGVPTTPAVPQSQAAPQTQVAAKAQVAQEQVAPPATPPAAANAGADVIESDLQGLVVRYPDEASKVFLWKPEEVVGKLKVHAFHRTEDSETVVPRLRKMALEAGQAEERVTLVRKDGSRF